MEAKAGSLMIGKGHPVSVQTMYSSPLQSVPPEEVVSKISSLHALGCDMIRFSFISEEDAAPFSYIASRSVIPVVADIHFDYRMALLALESGAHKIRINPGNIGARWKTEEVVKAALDRGAAIRIGLNSGSLPPHAGNETVPSVMVRSALEYLDWFTSWGFSNTVVSLKSSDTDETVEAARLFAAASDCPQHIGVTEAGSPVISAVRSAWAERSLFWTQNFRYRISIVRKQIPSVLVICCAYSLTPKREGCTSCRKERSFPARKEIRKPYTPPSAERMES